jgi:hypothetical protein
MMGYRRTGPRRLGVVTWLPALAATGNALQAWRADGDSRCFTGVLAAFPRYWRALWRHAVVSTVAVAVLVAAITFLAGRPEPVAIPLVALRAGIAAGLVVYHVALAAVAGHTPDGLASTWRRAAMVLAFGSPWRGLALLAAAVLAPILALPLAVESALQAGMIAGRSQMAVGFSHGPAG